MFNDSQLVQHALRHMVGLQPPAPGDTRLMEPTIQIMSMSSSSTTVYRALLPDIISSYKRLHGLSDQVHATVTHGVPPHKIVVNSENGVHEVSRESFSSQLKAPALETVEKMFPEVLTGDYMPISPVSVKSMSSIEWPDPRLNEGKPASPPPNSSIPINGVTPGLLEGHGNSVDPDDPTISTTATTRTTTTAANTTPNSTSTTPDSLEDPSKCCLGDLTIKPDPTLSIFDVYSYIHPNNPGALLVPPLSLHYSINIHTMPTHTVAPFSSITQARYAELANQGLMLVCYPVSMQLYYNHVLPCLDQTLLQLLALNVISSQTCEAVTMPPATSNFPSFENQLQLLSEMPGAEIIYAQRVCQFEFSDWGARWINEDLEWVKSALKQTEVYSSQIFLKLVQGMVTSAEWRKPGYSDVGIFVIRKSY